MNLQAIPLEYYAFSGLLNFVVGIITIVPLWQRRHQSSASSQFTCFTFLFIWWSLFYFLWLTIKNHASLADFLERTCMVPVVFMPPVFLRFSSELTGRFRQSRLHRLSYLLAIVILLTVYTPLFSPGVARFLVFPFWLNPGPTFFLHMIQMIASIAVGSWLIGSTARQHTGRMRFQLWWIFWGYALGFVAGCTNYLAWCRLAPPILNPLSAVYCAAIAYAIIKHQAMDIRVVIRKSLVYSLLIASITATYLVMVLVMERWFQGFLGYRSFVATIFVAFLIAIFFNPLRNHIQAFVDRALFKATPVELAEQREHLLVEVRKGDQMKAVATLAAGLAHEIKNPLTSVKTFTESLESRYEDPVFRAKFRKIVGGEVERINTIVQQLLEFAKPVPPKLMPVEVPKLVDETLEFLGNELVNHHVEVNRQYVGQLKVLADPKQLRQVFLNLFLNSLQAMNGAPIQEDGAGRNHERDRQGESRDRTGRLEVQTTVKGAELEITIADNGPGISPKDLPHIFEPFYTTKSNGTGLGLAVVHGIIKEHGGRINVTSQLGQGTTIRVSLPIAAS